MTASWRSLPALPTPRFLLAAAAGGDGRIYAIGGGASMAEPLATVEAFDPATGRWSAAASMPAARYLIAAATGADGRIYVFGGGRVDGLTSLDIYDPRTNRWSAGAPMPGPRFNEAAAAGPDGRIYVMGGGAWVTQGVFAPPVGTMDVYDPASDTWAP